MGFFFRLFLWSFFPQAHTLLFFLFSLFSKAFFRASRLVGKEKKKKLNWLNQQLLFKSNSTIILLQLQCICYVGQYHCIIYVTNNYILLTIVEWLFIQFYCLWMTDWKQWEIKSRTFNILSSSRRRKNHASEMIQLSA